ncbi:uncharacterized protein BDV17DRAFT_261977 [Aspergillus undulatus]|uniref:uncharacterized protein n=1 Tax=Aspergillus undulatus TaxID=1810928 RepID=UPI003CCD79F3
MNGSLVWIDRAVRNSVAVRFATSNDVVGSHTTPHHILCRRGTYHRPVRSTCARRTIYNKRSGSYSAARRPRPSKSKS